MKQVKKELKPGPEEHLCKMTVDDQEILRNQAPVVNNPRYISTACGRAANRSENPSAPTELQTR
jgi:hypothetical protein